MKERFKDIKLRGGINIRMDEHKGYWTDRKERIISHIVDICEEYSSEGYVLTLRQLYYQLVARDIIPNHDKVYKKISTLKDEAVYGGLIDWDVFEDRGRVPHSPYYEDSVGGALENVVKYYRLDRQRNQKVHVEVWTEKDAISSILKQVTNYFGITLSVNKGYTSSTAIYKAYNRFTEVISNGGQVKILYFGDHDPSGLDMIRDIEERILFMFENGESLWIKNDIIDWWERNGYTYYDLDDYEEWNDVSNNIEWAERFDTSRFRKYIKDKGIFEIIPVGLTMEQIREFNPPNNPAKITDPRAKKYIEEFGEISWEVDALRPKVMQDIVRSAIQGTIDMVKFDLILLQENDEREKVQKIIKSL